MLIDEIRERYRRYSRLFDGQESELPIGTTPDDFGGRHLEISSDGKLALVGTDRGRETKRQETRSVDELLYWIFVGQANAKAFYKKTESMTTKRHRPLHSRKLAKYPKDGENALGKSNLILRKRNKSRSNLLLTLIGSS